MQCGRVGSRPFSRRALVTKVTEAFFVGTCAILGFFWKLLLCCAIAGGLSRCFSLSMCRYDISGGIPNINTGERPRSLYSSFQVVFRGQVILSTDQILIVRGSSEEIGQRVRGFACAVSQPNTGFLPAACAPRTMAVESGTISIRRLLRWGPTSSHSEQRS